MCESEKWKGSCSVVMISNKYLYYLFLYNEWLIFFFLTNPLNLSQKWKLLAKQGVTLLIVYTDPDLMAISTALLWWEGEEEEEERRQRWPEVHPWKGTHFSSAWFWTFRNWKSDHTSLWVWTLPLHWGYSFAMAHRQSDLPLRPHFKLTPTLNPGFGVDF